MSVLAGFKTKVYLSGTPTTLTSEAMSTFSTVSNTYKVTNSAKQILDRDTPTVFKSGGVTISSSNILSQNNLFGTVTLKSSYASSTAFSGTVKVSGKYVPVTAVAGAHNYTLSMNRDLLDNTDYSSTGWKMRIPGLIDVSITLSRYDNISLEFLSLVQSGGSAVVDIQPGGTGQRARAWVLVEKDDRSGDVSKLEEGSVSLSLNGYAGDGNTFSWGT